MKSNIIVVGLGISGIAAARLLKDEGHQITIIDQQDNPEIQSKAHELSKEGINIELGKDLNIQAFKPWISKQLSSVIISPGIPWDHPTLDQLRKEGIKIKSEISLGWEYLKKFPWIGVTGTNGKTTVTYLINHILEKNDVLAPMGGNTGLASTSLALEINQKKQIPPDLLVIELSSYQIETAPEILPFIGIWTTFTADHLERHGTIEAYYSIKKNLLERSNIKILNADDPEINKQRKSLKNAIWVSCQSPFNGNDANQFWIDKQGYIVENNVKLFNSLELHLPGKHNLQNLLIATATARQLGVPAEGIRKSLSSFQGVPHRLEKVGLINGIEVINDSKATNYEAARIGLKAIKEKMVVIAGGRLKKGDPSKWLEEIHSRVHSVILFGEGGKELEKILKKSGFKGKLAYCINLQDAVFIGLELAKTYKIRHLILSPACASFDQYKNFEERGNHFQEIIRRAR